MVMRTALVKQEYAGCMIAPGDTFNVEDEHVRLLELLGRISKDLDQGYATADLGGEVQNRAMKAQTRIGGKRRK